jgi:hypothetical protein
MLFSQASSAAEYYDLRDGDWESLWDEASNTKASLQLDLGTVIQVVNRITNTVWYFTKDDDPLHPSIIRRKVVSLDYETKGWTTSSNNDFENWLRKFEVQDKKIQKLKSESCSIPVLLFGSDKKLPCGCSISIRPSVIDERLSYYCSSEFDSNKTLFIYFYTKETMEQSIERMGDTEFTKYENFSRVQNNGYDKIQYTNEANDVFYTKIICDIDTCIHMSSSNEDNINDLLFDLDL